jgi:PAS domain S-box-containing protein
VLIKPSSAATILARVARAIAEPGSPPASTLDERAFRDEHFRVVNRALVEKAGDLEASRQRLAALIEVGGQLASERNPSSLIRIACSAARDVTLAQQAVIGLMDEQTGGVATLVGVGFDAAGMSRLTLPSADSPFIKALIADRQLLRGTNPTGDPGAIGLPDDHPPVHSYLAVPIMSGTRVYGWIGLRNKLGADAFSELDEQVASTIGIQAAIAYENARLYADSLSRRFELEAEVRERERVGEELRTNQERTEFALEAARTGIWDLDLLTGRLVWSESLAAIFGLTRAEAPTSMDGFFRLVDPDDRERVAQAFEAAVAGGGDFAVEFRTARNDTGDRWVQGRARIFVDEDGRPLRALGVGTAISERKLLEQQLLIAQKLETVGQLAGGLAHDFNNLLTTVLGYANLIEVTFESDDPRRQDLAEIRGAAERAANLTRQLLATSRRQVVQRTLVDLNDLLAETSQMLRRLIGEHITLNLSLAEDLPAVRADPGQLEQIVMNLVVNARDAMADGGTLSVATADLLVPPGGAGGQGPPPGRYVHLRVQDTGTGMSDDTRAHLFEPFFTTKDRGKGTGLGLATVYSIVNQNDGHIEVASRLGEGTLFDIYLPVAEGVADRAPRHPTEPVRGGREVVLVVEDERAVRYLIRTALERAGYQVVDCGSPDEVSRLPASAIDALDLLVTDVLMPGSSGPDLYKRLSASHPELRVLYVSGYSDTGGTSGTLLEPDTAFLAKPFTADDLNRKVREVLDR